MNNWIILDCHYLAHRARYSRGKLSYDGESTGVIFGMLSDFKYLSDQLQSDNFAFCFDSSESKRERIFKGYKKKRKDKQFTEDEEAEYKAMKKGIRIIRDEILPKFGERSIFMESGFEADDLIASLVISNPKELFTIVSADHDLYQLLHTGRVSIFNPVTKTVMTEKLFKETYGINPSMWATVKAIAGCTSDSIPGIKGIGEGKAIQFLLGEGSDKTKELCTAFCVTKVYKRNLRLTTIPIEGTPVLQLKKRKTQPRAVWNNVCRERGIHILQNRPYWNIINNG